MFNPKICHQVFSWGLSSQVVCPLCRTAQPLQDGANALLEHLASEHAVRNNFNLLFTLAMLQPKHVGGKPSPNPSKSFAARSSPVANHNPSPIPTSRPRIGTAHLNSMMDEAKKRVDEKQTQLKLETAIEIVKQSMLEDTARVGGQLVFDPLL